MFLIPELLGICLAKGRDGAATTVLLFLYITNHVVCEHISYVNHYVLQLSEYLSDLCRFCHLRIRANLEEGRCIHEVDETDEGIARLCNRWHK